MIPVNQTILTPPLGNCYAACLASIFEVPLEAIPHPTEEDATGPKGAWDAYEERIRKEFLHPRGFTSVIISATEGYIPEGYAVLSAKSPRGDWEHAVVVQDGVVVHDPHPLRDMGIGKWMAWVVFPVIDPARKAANV